MIDKNSGEIIVGNKTTIGPNSSMEEILSLNLGQSRNQGDHKNGWTWLTERNVLLENKYFIMNFLFFDNKLKEIYFVVSEMKFNLESDWDSWSELQELLNLEKYKVWLANEVGNQEDFDWGKIWADYDSKGGSSSISMRYK